MPFKASSGVHSDANVDANPGKLRRTSGNKIPRRSGIIRPPRYLGKRWGTKVIGYETAALPLSYAGTHSIISLRIPILASVS